MRGYGRRLGPFVLVAYIASCAQIAYAQTGLPQITVQAPKQPHLPKPKPQPVPATTTPARTDTAVIPNGPAVTQTTAGPVSGYHALTAVTATKTATPIEQIPQSIVVLPRSVIDDQKPVTQDELFQNISGVAGMPENSLYGVNYKVRGFDAERYVDGLPNYNDGGDYASTVNTERIEVIKGPGGLFYQGGLGVIGGVINIVSKLPVATPQYQAGINAGSFGLYNPWFDVNQPLDSAGGVLFRMTGEFAHSRDYTDVIDRDSFSLNPTFTFDNHDGSTLTVQGSVSQRQNQTDVGLPATGTLDTSLFNIRPTLFFGNPDIPKATSNYQGVTVRFDRELSSAWSFNVATRYAASAVNDQSQPFFSNTPDVPPSSWAVSNFHVFDSNRDISVAPNLIGKFEAGPTQNTVLLGADYDRVHADVVGWDSFAGLVDLSNPDPVFPAYMDPAGSGAVVANFDERIVNAGLIGQLQSTIFDRLHVTAGVREAYVDVKNTNFLPEPSYDSQKTKPLPRFGAAYDLLHGVTMFAGYSEGLRGERFFIGTTPPKPEESQQIETGLKLALPSGFAATLAAFDIAYRNVPTGDPTMPLVELQAGEERSKGFDADLTWQPLAGLSILANYAYIDARVVQDNFFAVGSMVDFVPRNSGRLWANYKFQSGWLQNIAVGAGFYAASRQTLDLTNQFFTPGYTTFDGKIAYETKNWTLALVGKNLTDRQYFIPYSYFTLGRVAPGTPFTALASLTVRN
jgi:iron complex outermembrane receptor protein